MSCEIVTGKKQYAVSGSGSKEDKSSSVLFDNTSTKTVSHFIHVEPCQAYKISTFNLPDNVVLKLHRVLAGGGTSPQGSGCLCSNEEATMAKAIASEPFKINCKQVQIDNCDGVLFLTVPGTYMVELSDESALGNFYAFAEEVDCCCLPSGLIIGNVALDAYVGTARS